MNSTPRVIAIIGAGFSGAMTAAQLLRRVPAPARIVLIERGGCFGRGLAYARHAYPYLLNVPAMRMSAWPERPEHFLAYAQRRLGGVTGSDFLSRELYGDYLEQVLDDATREAPHGVELVRMRGEVVDLETRLDGGCNVRFADGVECAADDVVLANGHPPPATIDRIAARDCASVVVEDPWKQRESLDSGGPLLLVGTGLTMVDVVCAEIARDPDVRIHALSRHGLLPLSQAAATHGAADGTGFGAALRSARTVRELFRLARRHAAVAIAAGGDWRDTIMLIRHEVPGLWARLEDAERRRFMRHVRAYWDIHRHRVPERIAHTLLALGRSGRLSVHAGRLVSLQTAGRGVRVLWRPRGARADHTLEVSRVVNCTGADYDIRHAPDRLWQSLLSRGVVTQDALRAGIVTDPQQRIAGAAAGSRLYYVGPLLRAAEWEATAVPELRVRAQRVAELVSGT